MKRDPIRVTTLTKILRALRRVLTRNEWAIWLLGLKRHEGQPTERGLILVQIDGLSEGELKRALDENQMPFLKSLLEKEHYQRHAFYSGLPASTPAVQAELYYGVKTAVPAFGFRDHQTGRLVRMFANDIAEEVEKRIQGNNVGLLKGGSSYGNIYSGGADDVYFCATSFGWSEFFRTLNPFNLLFVMMLNFIMFFRVVGLMVIEGFVACFGFLRGVLSGGEFWQELVMIPARVMVVVLLRELVTIGACYDSARGLPIIHMNLLGYDEQAHRRGPGSKFAHWTLDGIDHSIRRIWRSAHLGAGREYDVWIFSDHGQEETTPFRSADGKSIQSVIADWIDTGITATSTLEPKKKNRLPTRANWLGIGWLVSLAFGEQDHDIQTRSPNVQTVTSGPLAFVYFLNDQARHRRTELARVLVDDYQVPMAAEPLPDNRVRIHSPEGTYELPDDAVRVFGADHPFLEDVAHDLIALVHHPDAGDLTLIGWDGSKTSTSFVLQHGAHAGPGTKETNGFAILPNDIALPDNGKPYLRPDDLRRAALHFLDRTPEGGPLQLTPSKPANTVRFMTYNVHGCVGMDGQLSPRRIARVIAQSAADIICLQELDVCRKRSGHLNQPHEIAKHLKIDHHFHPAWQINEEQYGNAILTRFPLEIIKAGVLHQQHQDRSFRCAMWVEIDTGGPVPIQLITTHLSIYPQEQLQQAREIANDWIEPALKKGPVVLCGDFNARPKSRAHKVLADALKDVETFDDSPSRSTYFSPFPVLRVDHIFVSESLTPVNVVVPFSRMARIASDHLPLTSDLKLEIRGAEEPQP